MTFDEIKLARESYKYIPARLVRTVHDVTADLALQSLKLKIDVPPHWEKGGVNVRSQYSSFALDIFHQDLLSSDRDDDLIHGLLSVVFWGYASGANNRVHAKFALSRSKALLLGRKNRAPQDPERITAYLRETRAFLKKVQIGAALLESQKIKFLGMSFASKVVTFMNPNVAAVYDAVISNRLKENSDPDLKSCYVSTRSASSQKG